MARKIIVFGLGDQSEDGFEESGYLEDYVRGGIFREYGGRFRFSQNKKADVIVLSREGTAFGHFDVREKVDPNSNDKLEYKPVKQVYLIRRATAYQKRVRLATLGITGIQFGKEISENVFQKILARAGNCIITDESVLKTPSQPAMNVLAQLVRRIAGGQVRAGHPESYPTYGEIHDALGLSMQGETVGQSLKHQGLEELAEWTLNNQHPAITGLIVKQESRMPGLGYFELFNRNEDDFEWWNQQVRDSLTYDWAPFIPSTSLVNEVADAPTPEAIDFGPADRTETTEYRILRDTAVARHVKVLHEYRCQICATRIQLPSGDYYAESHHIQPLGRPHNGPDVIGNILCLCPNHHAELDYCVRAITLADLRTADDHHVESRFVDFHNARVRELWRESEESYG